MSVRAINWAVSIFRAIDIPVQERAVLWAICYHHHPKSGECFPSYDTLALISGYRRRRVIQAVNWLREAGLIQVQKRRDGNRQASNGYRLFGTFKAVQRVPPSALSKKAKTEVSGCTTLHPEDQVFRVPPSAHDREYINSEDRTRDFCGDFAGEDGDGVKGGFEPPTLRLVSGGGHA